MKNHGQTCGKKNSNLYNLYIKQLPKASLIYLTKPFIYYACLYRTQSERKHVLMKPHVGLLGSLTMAASTTLNDFRSYLMCTTIFSQYFNRRGNIMGGYPWNFSLLHLTLACWIPFCICFTFALHLRLTWKYDEAGIFKKIDVISKS